MTNQSAQVALVQDDIERAAVLGRNALAAFAQHGERQGIAEGLETLAAVAAANEDPGRAAVLGGAAAAVRETISSSPAAFETVIAGRFLETAERTSGEERWQASWRAGRALSAETAVKHALAST
jgi:non-specific serine/threonine protein kinase